MKRKKNYPSHYTFKNISQVLLQSVHFVEPWNSKLALLIGCSWFFTVVRHVCEVLYFYTDSIIFLRELMRTRTEYETRLTSIYVNVRNPRLYSRLVDYWRNVELKFWIPNTLPMKYDCAVNTNTHKHTLVRINYIRTWWPNRPIPNQDSCLSREANSNSGKMTKVFQIRIWSYEDCFAPQVENWQIFTDQRPYFFYSHYLE